MKAVVYFSANDVAAARLFLATKKAEGLDVHWANSDEFENPRDVEFVDEVFLVSPSPRVEAAYAERGVKVTHAYQDGGNAEKQAYADDDAETVKGELAPSEDIEVMMTTPPREYAPSRGRRGRPPQSKADE